MELNSSNSSSGLVCLKSRILRYTAVPVLIFLIIAAVIMLTSSAYIIDSISRSDAAGSTELAYSRIESLIGVYGEIAARKSGKESLQRFLQTASERDAMDDNAYYSYALGELDSVISEYPEYADQSWLASVENKGVAFSNSSAGWIAEEDFDITQSPFYEDFIKSEGFFITDPYTSFISGGTVVSAIAPVRDSRTNVLLGVYGVNIKITSLWYSISNFPQGNIIFIKSGNNMIIYHDKLNMIYGGFEEAAISEKGNDGIVGRFDINGEEFIGFSNRPQHCLWTVYSVRSREGTRDLIASYSVILVICFAAACIIMLAALSAVSGKIAGPIRDYTIMIKKINPAGEDFGNFDASDGDILSPQGCSELEELAVGFNELIKRNREMLVSLKEMNIRSEKERMLYQTALQSSADVIFEYDIETDVLITYGSPLDSSVPKTTAAAEEGFLEKLGADGKYGAEDMEAAADFFSGTGDSETAVSCRTDSGAVRWLSFEGTTVFSEGVPVKVVGKIRCIDDVVSLKAEAETDRLSGLYNKAAAESMLEKHLADSKDSVLILVDIDNFKNVNDLLGHDYGDYVIKDIANKIRLALGKGMFAGRIGGDEFLIYSPDKSPSVTEQLCRTLCDSLRCTYSDESGSRVEVSASIGAALSPENGSTFDELYKCADIAMYVSKNKGKNSFTFYNGQERPKYGGRM